MNTFSRRSALTGSLAAAALAGLAACSGGGGETTGTSSGKGGGGGTTQWWEGGQPQTSLDKKIAADHKADLGDVEVTYQENTKLPQALQLAHQSNQMPDLTVIGGLGVPVAELVAQGWWQPLNLDDAANKRLKDMGLSPGIQIFDGKTYSFPTNLPDTNCVNWFHKDALTKAGLDPSNPPTTYDDFKAACQKIVAGGKMKGLLFPLKATGSISAKVEYMAQAAGWAGSGGQLFKTGEYDYHSDEWLNAIDFLMSLTKDKLMFAGNLNSTVKDGQARWASGATAFFWDGPWIPGNIKLHYQQIKGTVDSGPTIMAESGQQPTAYTNPPGNYYFIPKNAKHPDVANKILSIVAGENYQVMYAGVMAHLPLDPDAVDKSDAYPSFKKVAKQLYPNIFRAPDAVVGNQDVAKAQAVIKAVDPSAGAVIQGFFSGDVKDIKSALKKVSDASQKALEDSIKAAKSKGAKVSMDDWMFGNWKPRTNYSTDMYKAR